MLNLLAQAKLINDLRHPSPTLLLLQLLITSIMSQKPFQMIYVSVCERESVCIAIISC